MLPTEIVIFIQLVKYNKGFKFNKELTALAPQFFHPLSKYYLEYCKGAHTAPFLSSTLHEAFLCSCAKNIIFSSCRFGFVLKEIGLQKCLYLISFSAHILYSITYIHIKLLLENIHLIGNYSFPMNSWSNLQLFFIYKTFTSKRYGIL